MQTSEPKNTSGVETAVMQFWFEFASAYSCPAAMRIEALAAERGESELAREGLRTQTEEAQRLRIFGAPSFVVVGELFWGDDRLEDAFGGHARHAA